jgi:hypothetical protein
MRSAGHNHRLRSVVCAAALLAGAAVVQGCSGGSLGVSLPGLPSWFTRSDSKAAQANASVPVRQLDEDCPGIDVRTGAGTLAIASKAQEATANDLRYQLTFTEMVRQCFVEGGDTVRIRVGVRGRAVVGPAGAPSQISVPIRYAVVREGVQPRTITTKFRRLAVPLPPSEGRADFTDIEDDLSFPLPPIGELQAYVVYVGFDDVSDRQQPQQKQQKQKAPPKRLQRSVAPGPIDLR